MNDKQQTYKVLAIDPGIIHTGYSIIETNGTIFKCLTHGSISPKRDLEFSSRLAKIYNDISFIIKKYNPSCAAMEDIFVCKNPRSALVLGHARGSIILALEHANIKLYEYTSRDVKKQITGFGNADKEQVLFMVKKILGKELADIKSLDASDALGIGLCHIFRSKFSVLCKSR